MNTKSYILTLLVLILSLSVRGQVLLEPACAESIQQYGVDGFESSRFWWYFDHSYGQILEGDGTDTVTIQWGYPTGTIQLEVLEITSAGCSNSPSTATIEIMAPDVNLGDDFPEICDEDSLYLTTGDNFQEPYQILWSNGSTDEEYYAFTTEQIWVRVTDGFGCFRYDTVSLLVNPLPSVNLGSDTIYCNQSMPLTLNPGNFAVYNWTTTSGIESNGSMLNVNAATFVPDTVILSILDYNACPASDTMVIIPCDLEELFRDIPNMITPDGNGQNDTWNIPYMQYFDEAVLEIFDRWGRLVYRTANVLEEPWDGTSNGNPLPMDSYYFVLNLNTLDAPPIVGTINIIR